MTDASELRRLFDEIADLPEDGREAAIAGLDVDADVRDRLRTMLAIDDEIARDGDDEPPPRTHPWPGDTVGAYRLVAPIGDGGMGTVWLAVSRAAPEVDVAIKLAIPSSVSVDEARARLEQERRVLASLDHPGIVPIVDAGTTAAGVPYLALVAIHGRTVDVHARERALAPPAVVKIFERVADALDHAHERGIVHRDVKPQNVLVTEDGTPVLVDFGAAKITEASDLTARHMTVGSAPRTPAYASPEQERGEVATPQADVYALGLTLRAVLDARGRGVKFDRGLAKVLDRACHERPERRFASARAFGDALCSWRRRRDLRLARRRTRWRAVIVTIVVILLLGQFSDDGRQQVDPADAELRSALLDGLAEMPATEIPADHETLALLAERTDSVDWAIAALVRAIEADEYALALDAVGGVLSRVDASSPLRRVELVGVCSDLGLPGPTVQALSRVNVELLDPVDRLELGVLAAVNRSRAGAPPSRDELAKIGAALEAFAREAALDGDDVDALDLEAGGPRSDLFQLRLALGDTPVVTRWLEDVEDVAWRDPREASTAEIEALLGLHTRLRALAQVPAIDDGVLAAIEAELELRGEEDGLPVRAWATARFARALGALSDRPRRARDLAQAGVVRILETGVAPLDVVVRLGAIGAVATAAAGGADQAREPLRETAEVAAVAMGEDSPVTRALVRFSEDPTGASPPVEVGIVGDLGRLRRALEKEARLRRSRPWWAPGS